MVDETPTRIVDTTDRSSAFGRVEVAAYDTDLLGKFIDQWDEMDDRSKLTALDFFDPDHTQQTHNTVCVGLHEFCVDAMDPSQSVENPTLYVAVGNDNNTAPAYEDRSLNNEGYRSRIAQPTDAGADVRYITLLGANEANDLGSISELGVVCVVEGAGGTADTEYLFNHALIGPEPKSSEVALSLKNTIGFNPA